MKKSLLSTILFLTFFTAFSQVKQLHENQDAGKGNVEELAWLEGLWTGTGFGGGMRGSLDACCRWKYDRDFPFLE
ncbi:hypothetical protein [Algoriphagus aquimarinus]|uniref:hypothetical protein n=1 Tax=Algoriphagus aquimarinus TaxID=237018 RepID=UPI0030D8C128|tara:strand:- start:7820 stop:8044 length:225 start_codon:yes stop_codon:yes gene_type:complete